MKSNEAEAVVEYLRESAPDTSIEDHLTFYLAEARSRITIDFVAVGERLGRPLSLPEFLVSMSSYYGRVDVDDSAFIVTSEMLQLDEPSPHARHEV